MTNLIKSKVSTDKNCKQMTDLVLGYVTGKLPAKTKREFDRHLSICPDCVSFLNTYKKTVTLTKTIQADDIPAKVRENVMNFLRKQIRRVGMFVVYLIAHIAA